MVAQSRLPRKPAPRVTVVPRNVGAGLYATLSSNGRDWYITDVKNVTCTCKAGAAGFNSCKRMPYCRHMVAAKLIAYNLAHMSRAGRAACLRCTVAVHVNVEAVIARQQQPAAIAA